MLFDNEFQKFKDKYHIKLNEQQEKAVRAIEGANLLLAVPGSGKTTVLITRLGHMVINQKISPESILAISFNKETVKEMKERFCSKFGRSLGEKINFRTVNSLSFEIYKDYCAKSLGKDIKDLKEGKDYYKIIEEKEKLTLLLNLLKKDNSEYVYENDIHKLNSEITLIKNSINKNQMMEIENVTPDIKKKLDTYNNKLKNSKLMDYEDQLIFGHAILAKCEEFAKHWQSKYKYICVDEAQDLSEIQHEIVKILAKGNNIFMVGDEDQSIYSFRGAYPKALLNFKNEYTNASIMYMERNYRSTPQIVQKAKEFISQNKNRYKKNMTAEQNEGQEIILDNVTTRETQYRWLAKKAENIVDETAFLYRENESAIVLVDLLLRNNIHFKLHESNINFFESKVIKEVICYLKLAINDRDIESFKHICNKGILKIPGNQKDYTIKNLNRKNISVYEALKTQLPYLRSYQKENVYDFCDTMQKVSHSNSFEAISILLRDGYAEYLNNKHVDKDKINILQILAKQEPDIRQFLNRLDKLKKILQDGHNKNQTSSIILSTIHSSKGLEYKNVYLVDVYDGKLPSCGWEDEIVYEEERRMFYVAITRARKGLYLTNIEEKTCSFINELFHKPEKLAQNFNNSYEIHPKKGMVLFHKNYGEIEIVDTKKNGADTIIYVVDSNGEISSKSWNILLLNNQITLL